MDPLTLSTTFATIVGLICNFKQERKGQRELSNNDFFEWLEKHHHHEIKDIITRNQNLSIGLEILIKEEYETLVIKLNKIDDILAKLVSQIDGFKEITNAIKPSSGISKQAVNILEQLVESNSNEFGKIINYRIGHTLSLHSGGNIQYNEPRFLEDDLNSLVNLGLLRLRVGSKGTEFYGITRNAVKFIEATNV